MIIHNYRDESGKLSPTKISFTSTILITIRVITVTSFRLLYCSEEVEKQKAALHYQKLHAEGKTEEARADLARLAIIKQQREEAAKKREQEKQGDLLVLSVLADTVVILLQRNLT